MRPQRRSKRNEAFENGPNLGVWQFGNPATWQSGHLVIRWSDDGGGSLRGAPSRELAGLTAAMPTCLPALGRSLLPSRSTCICICICICIRICVFHFVVLCLHLRSPSHTASKTSLPAASHASDRLLSSSSTYLRHCAPTCHDLFASLRVATPPGASSKASVAIHVAHRRIDHVTAVSLLVRWWRQGARVKTSTTEAAIFRCVPTPTFGASATWPSIIKLSCPTSYSRSACHSAAAISKRAA